MSLINELFSVMLFTAERVSPVLHIPELHHRKTRCRQKTHRFQQTTGVGHTRKISHSPDASTKDDEDNSLKHTQYKLHMWPDVRRIEDKTTRFDSVTFSTDACVKEGVRGKDALLEKIDEHPKALEILCHLALVYIPQRPSRERLFEYRACKAGHSWNSS